VVLAALVVVCAVGNTAPKAYTSSSSAHSGSAQHAGSSAHAGSAQHGALSDSGPHPIVALGDSVPSGAACGCTPYPQLSGSGLTALGVRDVSVDNHAVGGYTTEDVVEQLTDDTEVISDLKRSDLTEVEIGANDIGHSVKCGTSAPCYAPMIPEVENNLRTIVQRVHQLTAGHSSLVVLLDYWNVWLGGRYAQAKGQAYVAAAAAVTNDVSNAIKTVAEQTGSAYVDLRAAFKGPDYTEDETAFLASDGDHPNAAGHRLIASAVEQVVQAQLHLTSPP
jgi:lysophospholipase L1-like esterase